MLHVDYLLPITNVNNNKLTDFAAISLPEVIANEIDTYYALCENYILIKNGNNSCLCA